MSAAPTRRDLLAAATGAAAAAAAAAGAGAGAAAAALPAPAPPTGAAGRRGGLNPLPRWRGFNLQWMLGYTRDRLPLGFYREQWKPEQLDWMTGWGFDHVRLGTSYWDLLDQDAKVPGDEGHAVPAERVMDLDPARVHCLRECVDLLLKHGLHVDLTMHRLPGSAVWRNFWEPFSLFEGERGEAAIRFWWSALAGAFADVPADRLSFNLLNELPAQDKADHATMRTVMLAGTEAVRAVSPERVVLVDGSSLGKQVMDHMLCDPVCHSLHAYMPMELSHVNSHAGGHVKKPISWPVLDPRGREFFGPARLEAQLAEWVTPATLSRGVHCGEAGVEAEVPAEHFLPYMADLLSRLTDAGIGYALWQFVGGMGLLDTGRPGMRTERWHGHDLDVELLELLKAH